MKQRKPISCQKKGSVLKHLKYAVSMKCNYACQDFTTDQFQANLLSSTRHRLVFHLQRVANKPRSDTALGFLSTAKIKSKGILSPRRVCTEQTETLQFSCPSKDPVSPEI
jgi:hypothetical protein